jgi:hypothetical protein
MDVYPSFSKSGPVLGEWERIAREILRGIATPVLLRFRWRERVI